MKKQTVNILTTLFGLLLIPCGVYTVIKTGVSWWDFLGCVSAALVLIYTKNTEGVSNIVNKVVDKKFK